MRSWILRAPGERAELVARMRRGKTDRFALREPPTKLSPGDLLFFWHDAPSFAIEGIARVSSVEADQLEVRYEADALARPIAVRVLRDDPVLAHASFLKAPPHVSLIALDPAERSRLVQLIVRHHPELERHVAAWTVVATKSKRTTSNGAVESPARGPAPRAPRERSEPRERALSIRQPHVEAILRGRKRAESRSRPTTIRGRVLVYAALKRGTAEEERASLREYRLEDVDLDALPRGVIVGAVEVVDCIEEPDGSYSWLLRAPERWAEPRAPEQTPKPSWFFPWSS